VGLSLSVFVPSSSSGMEIEVINKYRFSDTYSSMDYETVKPTQILYLT